MSVTKLNKLGTGIIGASLFVPSSTAQDLYETVLDVQNFPKWAPGVRRVEVVEGAGEPGMVSEWQVSLLGLKRKISSVLEESESPALLRWTYEGPVCGWGQCNVRDWGDGALAEFRTELFLKEPVLQRLMRTPPVGNAATGHLKRYLTRLGLVISGNSARVRVGPLLEELG